MRSTLVPIVAILSISPVLAQTRAPGSPAGEAATQRLVVFEDFMRPT